MSTALAIRTGLAAPRIIFSWTVLAVGRVSLFAAPGVPAASEWGVPASRAPETAMATSVGCISELPAPSRAASGAAPPLQACQCFGDLLTGIVCTHALIILSLVVHASILHVD